MWFQIRYCCNKIIWTWFLLTKQQLAFHFQSRGTNGKAWSIGLSSVVSAQVAPQVRKKKKKQSSSSFSIYSSHQVTYARSAECRDEHLRHQTRQPFIARTTRSIERTPVPTSTTSWFPSYLLITDNMPFLRQKTRDAHLDVVKMPLHLYQPLTSKFRKVSERLKSRSSKAIFYSCSGFL